MKQASPPVHGPGISSKELIRYLFPDHLLLPWPTAGLGEEQVAGLCPGYLLCQPGPTACPVPPSSLSARQLHTGAFHQPEDQTPARSQPRRRVLTRAAFIGALAQAQAKQDIGSEAAGRTVPVWAEATGVTSIFSSLGSMAGPGMASPSLRLRQPRGRAKGTDFSAAFGSLLCSALHGAGKHLEPSQGNHV